MHKKAQYIDGKLIGEDGKEIKRAKLPPPPPLDIETLQPPPVIEEHPKRKNISISYETWVAWKEIKGRKNWDAVLIDALEIFHKIKKLEDVIIQVALQKPTIIQQVGGPVPGVPIGKPISRATPIAHKKKLPFLEEIKEIVDKLEEGKGIRSILKNPEDNNEEIEKIQKTDEELEEIMEKTAARMKGG